MSSAQGFPDWQRITQWLGPPIAQNTGLVIGAALHTDGPFQVSNFASVIVSLKAAVGNVTVTIKQTVPAGPASLVLTETVIVPAGATLFEAFVLFGGAVELDLTGSVAGTSVDYALYGSNTTTNAQVITNATINVQHNEVLVAAEGTLDFVDAGAFVWGVADDAVNTRVKVTPPRIIAGRVSSAGAILEGSGFTVVRNTVGDYTVTFSAVYAATPNVQVTLAEQTNFGMADLVGVGAGSFRVNTASAAGAGADRGFSFFVHPY